MRKILALGAGAVLAFAPTSTAFAVEAQGTGAGKAYGNCGTSSAGGVRAPAPGSAANGNGGHVKRGVKSSCGVVLGPPAVVVGPPTGVELSPPPPDGDGVDNSDADAQ